VPTHIRTLHEADEEAVWALRLRSLSSDPEAFGGTFAEAVAAGSGGIRRRLRETSEDAFYLGAWDGEQLVGMVRFKREEGAKDRHRGEVASLFVVPERRGQGVGRALLDELIARAGRLPGLEQLQLAVVSTNASAARLYRAFGFAVYGTLPHALKDGDRYEDEDLMVLFLGV